MAELGPIEVKFAINEEEFAAELQRLKQELSAIPDTLQQQSAQLTGSLDQLFNEVAQLMLKSFSPDKLQGLHQSLQGVTDDMEQLKIITNFLRENIHDLKLDPTSIEQVTQTLDQLNEAIHQNQIAYSQATESFNSGTRLEEQSIQQLEEQLDQLIAKERQLVQAIRNAHDPELLSAYNRGLEQTRQEMNAIAEQLDRINQDKFQQPASTTTETTQVKMPIDEVHAFKTAISGLFGVVSSTITAIQLFTGEDEELGKTMMKLFSVFTIVMGVEQALNLVKQAGNIITTAQILLTNGLTASKQAEATATEAATTAQYRLNAAMEANPIGLLIVAITALVTTISVLISKTKDATEVQTELYNALQKVNEAAKAINDLQNQEYEERIQKAKNEIAFAQARGATEQEILELKIRENEEEIKKINFQKGYFGDELKSYETEKAKLQLLISQASALEQQQILTGKLSKSDEERLNLLNAQIQYFKNRVSIAEQIRNEEIKLTGQQQALLAEQQRLSIERARKSASAEAEARVLTLQEGTDEWLRAEIQAIETRKRIALQNEELTAGERKKIIAQTERDIQDAIIKYKQFALDQEEALIKARLANVKQGSQEEFRARIALVEIEAQKQLQQVGLTSAQQQQIEAEKNKKIYDLARQYNLQLSENEIEIKRAAIQQQLSIVKQGSQEELNLRKQLVQLEENEEIAKAQATIDNEKLLQAKITAIHADAINKIRQLDEQYLRQQYQSQIESIRSIAEHQSLPYQDILNNPFSTNIQKLNAQHQIDLIQLNALLQEQRAAQDALNEANIRGLKDAQAYEKELQSIRTEIERITASIKSYKQQSLVATFMQVSDYASQIARAFGELSGSLQQINPALSDTLQTMSDIASVASNMAKSAASLASGDIIGGITSAISAIVGVFGIIGKSRQSALQAMKEIRAYQDQLLMNEIEYNELLRERARTQGDITKMTTQELDARKQMLELQKQQALADYDRLLNQIYAAGQQITGEHTEKYGGFLGIGRKTRVVQDLAGLAGLNYDQLEKLYVEGKLTDETKKWFEELKKVHDEMSGIDDQISEIQDQIKQQVTGTTAESIADSIVQGFADGKKAISDFASDFESLMKQAILNSLKERALTGPLQNFYDYFAELAQSGNQLTQSEIDQLRGMYNAIISNAQIQFEELQQIAGMNFNDLSKQSGLSGTIQKSITEDTANELAGLMRGQYDTIKRQYQLTAEMLGVQINIQANTANTVQRLDMALDELKNIANNTKPAMTTRDIGG